MSCSQDLQNLIDYLYSLSIYDHTYVFEKDKMIENYNKNGLLKNIDTFKQLIFEITNYNNNIINNLLYFIDKLIITEFMREKLCNDILTIELNSDTVYDIYISYIKYLTIMPIG